MQPEATDTETDWFEEQDLKCKATRKFTLGDRAEALATCELSINHDSQHWAIDLGDGWSIIFRWL